MGKPIKTTCAGIARTAKRAVNMVIDAVVTVTFFVGALLISAVVLWILTGEDDDSI